MPTRIGTHTDTEVVQSIEDPPPQPPEGYRIYGEQAPRDINLDPGDQSLILTGKRTRKPASNQNDLFSLYVQADTIPDYLLTFNAAITKPPSTTRVPRIY